MVNHVSIRISSIIQIEQDTLRNVCVCVYNINKKGGYEFERERSAGEFGEGKGKGEIM